MLIKDVPCTESWFELSKACNRGASRHFEPHEAWPRPRLGRQTYWHMDKTRLTGTRNYIILLLESQQGSIWRSCALWCLARILGRSWRKGTALRLWKLQQNKKVRKDEASLKAGLETRLQGRAAMEIWNKTPRGTLRGRPGAIAIGAKQSIYIYISQGRGPFLVLKRQEKADTQTWASLVFDQNGVPKPGAQNRQFCGDAWAYPHSIYIYTHNYN